MQQSNEKELFLKFDNLLILNFLLINNPFKNTDLAKILIFFFLKIFSNFLFKNLLSKTFAGN